MCIEYVKSMQTKVQRAYQKSNKMYRYQTSVPKNLVEAMDLEGTKLEWKIIERDRLELTVKRDNGDGSKKKSGSGN